MTESRPRPPLDDPRTWLEEHSSVVTHVARGVARRRGLPETATAALESAVRAQLAADDYRALRGYSGGASLQTYIAVVAGRVLLDQPPERRGPVDSR